ncbi:MAG: tRNA uridine-5-carboxymethylaminomethyl(34) synthesis GTPase MnmE [Desulfohalobiaceae bacterium]
MQNQHQDTIAAIATPLGRGGVGIVRLSGQMSLEIGWALFRPARRIQGLRPYTLHHGWVLDQEQNRLDEVLVSYMPGPGSYTGEDVLEINCHGGPAVLQLVLQAVLRQGARSAGPGEFTLRAFLNGRLDLSQAESVAEVINSQSQAGLALAGSKLQGQLGLKVQDLKQRLEELRTQFCLAVDFPEEELECLPVPELEKVLAEVQEDIHTLLQNYQRYRPFRQGALVVLAGQVNAGKSSLLNALLGSSRAIVTPAPGTTRDYLEEGINLDGLPVRLVDTAGLRSTGDQVELAGLEQGKRLMQDAEQVCLVLDSSQGVDQETRALAQELPREKVLAVLNKLDLGHSLQECEAWCKEKGLDQLGVSAKTGQNLDSLAERIRERIVGRQAEPGPGDLVPNLRQKESLLQAQQELQQLASGLKQQIPFDLLQLHLDAACHSLAEITGEITSEDILERIFSSFCIGK